jgi:hypothetical protein
MSTLNEWKAIAEYHRNQLAVAEAKIKELSLPPEPEQLSPSEMKKRVIAIETRRAHKPSWKKAVDDGLLENVQGILHDCYLSLKSHEDNGGTPVTKVMEVIGKKDSLKQQEFELSVIESLWKNGSFIDEDGSFNTFEDTAGGCDEVTWDVACELIAQ